ncbi:hypothetical protein G9C98_004022 [Cotesia typhae]|uniref:non-specific serine/threonine protein kinase n=1 Tax=Cotesia typhae TaxID=2053667 RepID=A0A8J5QXP6_9HYME|nr:hypothetical protein G9C98_004022 [Cotesia typhae]
MDSVKEFMNIFLRCWKERRGAELERLFRDGPQYFQDVPQSCKALALITVFDKKNGLTVFLTTEIDRPVIDKDLQLSFHTAFHLIQFFITEYSDVLLPHVILIKYYTMRYEKPNILQTNIESLMDLLYNFPPDENDPEIIKFYERVKEVVEGAREAPKSGIIRALIKLMTQQMFTFKNLVFRDHEFWQNKLKLYRDDKQYSDLATPALQVYYEVIAKVLNERAHENNQNIKAVLHNLKGMFVRNLTEDLMLKDLRMNINGLSQFAEPIKKAYSDIVVEEVYSLVAKAHEYFDDISDYQESLSRILVNISNISHDQIKAILKLSILLIKRYPELSPLSQRNAIDSLKRTFSNISKFKLRISQEYIKNLVFESVVWSCSHSLLIDAEHQRDIENLPKRPLCYKDYVPLWKGLLNSTDYELSVQQQVINEIIEVCIELIKTLNLKIKTREDNIFSDIAASKIAENETDFRIFHNMVDLYDEIFDDIIPQDPKDKFTRFLYQVIRASYQYPLIAGFYRLADRILNAKYFIEDYIEDKELNKMVVQYLQNTIDSVGKFPQELQVSCIHLVLHTPVVFLSYLIDQSIPIFKIALTIGLSHYDLANSALTALENYVCTIDSEKLNEFVRELLPNLEMYLRSKESIQIYNETFDANEKSVFNNDEGLEKLQKRILLLFGRFEQSTVLEFLYTQSLNTGASWDKKDLLKYSLHFPDYTLDIYLDTMLPRIVELAQNSSDRRTKVAASEVLHSLVSIVLGKTVQYLSADADRFAPIYKTLCPVLLRLGCDADDVIRQIFSPLVLQLTHWLSSKLMLYSPSVCFLVDALFDGLSDETNSTLRDFSGVCLAEFAKWTIKQSTDQDLLRAPININTIVENITNFALHPSKNRRIAAAIAFNYLYNTLATHQEIVSVFWLELLYAFIKSHNGCNDTSIQISLENVKKVLTNRSQIFNQIEPRRKVPIEFEGGTLEDTVNWLLYQCESLDTNVRKKSMELFVALSSKVETHKSPKNFMMAFLENDGIQGLNTIILKDSADVMFEINLNSKKAEKFLKIILRMLDCYIWILRADLIDGDNLLFEPVNLERRRIFNCIKCFIVSVLNMQDKENNFIQCLAKINNLVCEAILTLFDFIVVILTTEFSEKNWALQELFNQNLYSLISRCVIEPHKIGFDVKNLLATESLPLKLEELLITLKTKLPGEYLNCIENELKSAVKNLCPFLFNFKEDQNYKLQVNSVKGLLLLNKCQILYKLKVADLSSNTSEAIDQIFNSLKSGESDQWYIELSSDKKKYFGVLLKLLLSYQSKAASKIIERLMADKNLEGAPQSKITHGEYFFNTFKDVLIPCLLNDIDDTMKELTNLLQRNADVSLFITEEMVIWVLKHKNNYQEILEQLSDELIERFEDYRRVLNNLEKRKKLFRNIFRTVVRFKNNPLEISFTRGPMYAWILKELNETNDLLKKMNVLNDFLICLTGENSHSPEIRVMLDGLKQAREAECFGGITGKTLMNSIIKECLQKLIVLLPITKSTDVFYATINFSIGAGDYLFNEATSTCIDNFFSHVVHDALKHIEVAYDLFMTKTVVRERLDVLKHFLLPGLRACNSFIREQFFNKYMKNIFATIIRTTTNNLADDKRLIVSQIGCYNFIELMFANLSLEKINNNEGVIAKCILRDSSNELVTQRIFKCTYQIRSFKSSVLDFQEIVRLLHCAAYNCAITIASETKDSKYYLSLFAENRSNGQLIWENIVDCKKVYELSQTFKEYPKQRKKLVNIRQTVRDRQNDPSVYTYIKSYDLATSTLNENVYAHDFNEVSLREPSAEKSVTVTLEVDDFNNHECMAPICAILEIISETGPGFLIPDPNNPPRGLTLFAGSMGYVHKNAKLFMLKVILNNQKIFRPYAKLFLAQIIDIIILLLDDGPLNYIITDGLLMLVDWAELAIPDEKLRQPANQLFSLLVDKVDEGPPSEYIIRYNFRIIEVLIQVWHKILTLPKGLELRMKCTRDRAVRVILILLANNMATDLISRPDILDYLIDSLKEAWNAREEVVLHTCEAIGLFIKFSRTEENFEVENDITEKIHPVLRSLQHKNSDRVVKCIHVMVKAYPLLAGEFFNHIIDNFSKVAPPSMAKCLEVFLQRMPHMSPENIIRDLNYIKFYELLSNKVISCEKVCLEIVENLVAIIDPARLVSIAETVESYAQHESLAYRKLMYSIFINIYKKYLVDITDLADIQKLIDMSKKILLRGLLDPYEELQLKLMTFWTEEVGLREKCTDRILDILDIYSPEAEKDFLTIFAIIFLHMTNKSPSYNQVMFEPLNQSCNYRDYAVAISWRMKNLSYKIPLFTSSYANHYSQRHSLSSLNVDNIPENDSDLMLRATMNTATSWMDTSSTNESFVAGPSTSTLRVDDVFVIPKTPSLNVVSRRFPKEFPDSRTTNINKKLEHYHKREEILRQKLNKQRNDVRLNRTYRIGDFPDISITPEAVLTPLQELLKKDNLICKDLTVSMIHCLVDQVRNQSRIKGDTNYSDFIKKFELKLNTILENHRESGHIIAMILEMMFRVENIKFDSTTVARVSKATDFNCLRALLLERNLITGTDEPPAKKMRLSEPSERDFTDEWVQLADLYESTNEVDVVLSIFQNHVSNLPELSQASAARANNKWENALQSYEAALDHYNLNISEADVIQRHCQQSVFECLARLSNWEQIIGEIELKVENSSLENFIEVAKSPGGWFAPWYFKAFIYQYFTVDSSNIAEFERTHKFSEDLAVFLKIEAKVKLLKELFAEDIAAVCAASNEERSKDLIDTALDQVREQWFQLSPLSTALRSRQITKLRGISNIDVYYKATVNNRSKNLLLLKNYWSTSYPHQRDDLLPWDMHIACRENFSKALKENFMDEDSSIEGLGIEIEGILTKLKYHMIEAAFQQRNKSLMRRYLFSINNSSDKSTPEFSLQRGRYNILSAQLGSAQDKLKQYTLCWNRAQKIVIDEETDINTRINTRQFISEMAANLIDIGNSDQELFQQIVNKIEQNIVEYMKDSNDVINGLNLCSVSNLKACCIEASRHSLEEDKIRDCYLKLLKYCHGKILTGEVSSDLIKEFVNSTLRAMLHNSQEAANYFPCLLNVDYLQDQETKRIFKELTQKIPLWRFLKWQAQLLYNLSTPLEDVVAPIIKNLFQKYPDALIYSLRLAMDTNTHVKNHPVIQEQMQLLSNQVELENFIEAMEYLVKPELYLQYYLKKLKGNSVFNAESFDIMLQKIYPDVKSLQGNLYKKISKYHEEIKRFKAVSQEEFLNNLNKIMRELMLQVEKFKDSNSLRDYSPWLSNLSGTDIEIPGQYSGDSEPFPKYHAKIMKIEPKVHVMKSKSKPVKITIIGNDAKNYNFLVKFGEDLRLDERVERAFGIMNEILRADIACSQRNLTVNTYQIIALSGSLGLIQWIDNTRSLNEYINFDMNEEQKKRHGRIREEYVSWMGRASPNANPIVQYKEALIKYNSTEVVAKMNELIAKTEWDLLRRTFMKLNPSLESFITSRRNFVVTYATMCVAHWILGIGDRHLENTLIKVESGKCTGIDFESSFGGGIDQVLPECMPFRLTKLENQHSDEKYYSRYSAILKGEDGDQSSMRIRIRDSNLTPEEQVKCLLNQATDLNILGRTYAGWSPWI